MSVYLSMGRGSYIVDRLGLRKRTGIYDYDQAHEFEKVLIKLERNGRTDLIEAFRKDEITGAELLASVERYGMNFQLTVESSIRLRRAMYEWLRDSDLALKTRKDYRWNLGTLVGTLPPLDRVPTAAEEKAMARGPLLKELPGLLAKYARRATPAMFVQVRAACQSFVRDTVPKGEHSDLWREVAAIKGAKRQARNVMLGLGPERARAVAEALAAEFDAVTGQVWWMLCCTGMEPKECFRENGWAATGDRIEIRGTKTKEGFRVRSVPRLMTPVRPSIGIKTFRKRLKAVGDKMGLQKLTPYVARRTFAHFLELAQAIDGQILDSQCDLLMGHSPKTDRARYREHDMTEHFPAIAAALRKAIGTDPQYMKAMA